MKIGQGKDKVKDFLQQNKEVCDEIEQKVRNVFASNTDLIPTEIGDESAPAEAAEAPEAAAEEEKPKKRSKKKVEENEDEFAEFSTEDIE